MEKPISVGDLVMVVRTCCLGFLDGSSVYRVENMRVLSETFCLKCGRDVPGGLQAIGDGHRLGIPLTWLKRIPPLSELEGQRDASGLDVRQPSPADFERMVKKMQESLK